MKNLKNYLSLILIILLSYFAIKPLLISGFFTMHDDTQVARVYEMGKALKDGMFPVRWVSDLGYGYGYPLFNFYAPLAYYFGGIFTVLGFDALTSTKLMMGIGILLSGIFMYFLAREFWGEIGGVLSALFYLFAPYHALDIYVRGDVSELFAYAFIPIVFYGLFKTYREQKWKWVVVGSLGYAGLILSHNLTAMIVTPFLVIIMLLYCYIAYKTKRLNTIYYILYTILIGLLLSAFYWLPALSEMQYTNVLSQIGGAADFKDHFVCFPQLWNSLWGFGGSVPGCIDGMSFKIGKLHVILPTITLSFLVFIKFFKRVLHYNDTYYYSDKKSVVFLLVLGLVISAFLTLEMSKPIWETVSFMAFLQYPWRFLILISFFSSFLAGSLTWFLPMRARYLAGGVLVLLLLYFNAKLFQPQTFLSKNVKDYTTSHELRWRVSRISDEYLPKDFPKPNEQEVARERASFDSNIKIESVIDNTQNLAFDLDVLKQTKAIINIAYFPSWRIFTDQGEEKSKRIGRGYEVLLPTGHRLLNIQFIETPIEKTANILSLIGIVALVIGIINKRIIFKNE